MIDEVRRSRCQILIGEQEGVDDVISIACVIDGREEVFNVTCTIGEAEGIHELLGAMIAKKRAAGKLALN